MTSLRDWKEIHQNEDLGSVRGRRFENALISECRVTDVAKARFINCDLRGTRVDIDNPARLLGVTMTLDCYSLDGLRPSELVLDTWLFLLSRTDGNDDKRAGMLGLIDPLHRIQLERAFEFLGR